MLEEEQNKFPKEHSQASNIRKRKKKKKFHEKFLQENYLPIDKFTKV